MSRKQVFLCPTPGAHCQGSDYRTFDARWPIQKAHQSRKEARRCYIRYLINELHYERTDKPGELRMPEGGIYIVAKESQFGMVMRQGKEDRFMPKQRPNGGVING